MAKTYRHKVGDLVFLMPFGLGYVSQIKTRNPVYPYIVHWLDTGTDYKMSEGDVKHYKDILRRYLAQFEASA